MTFTAIVVGHADEDGLRSMLGNLRYQTRRPDEILVYACCTMLTRLREEFPEAVFQYREHRGDWGHADRAAGLEAATGDYVGFFNSDDSYDVTFVETMMRWTPSADVVYCGWNELPDCDFRCGSSTSGNFIARTEFAREVGYPATADYENDGHFIDALSRALTVIAHVDEVLYFHNVR